MLTGIKICRFPGESADPGEIGVIPEVGGTIAGDFEVDEALTRSSGVERAAGEAFGAETVGVATSPAPPPDLEGETGLAPLALLLLGSRLRFLGKGGSVGLVRRLVEGERDI